MHFVQRYCFKNNGKILKGKFQKYYNTHKKNAAITAAF